MSSGLFVFPPTRRAARWPEVGIPLIIPGQYLGPQFRGFSAVARLAAQPPHQSRVPFGGMALPNPQSLPIPKPQDLRRLHQVQLVCFHTGPNANPPSFPLTHR